MSSFYDTIRMAATAGATCYNSTHCSFPDRCIVETGYRRYCGGAFISRPGRTLFDLSGEREPGRYGCERCGAPLALADFGLLADFGAYQCGSRCALPSNASTSDTVVESYQTSLCLTECTFVQGLLHGNARLGTSAYVTGSEPADRLSAARAHARNATLAAMRASRTAQAAARVAEEVDRIAAERSSAHVRLQAELAQAQAALGVARYLLGRARSAAAAAAAADTPLAAPENVRSTAGAVDEAQAAVVDATANRDAAVAAIALHEASAPFPPILQAIAEHAEALVAENAAAAARELADVAAAAAEVAGLQRVPLGDEMRALWGRDNVWGGSAAARPAGGLLQLTSSSAVAQRRRPSVGWAQLEPGRSLHAFRCELDLLIGGGDGGDGFAISYAPPSAPAIRASVEESRWSGIDEAAFADGRDPTASDDVSYGFSGLAADEAAGLDAASGGRAPPAEPVPAASAAHGLGASVDRGPLQQPTQGIGLSVSLATRPAHAAMVWFNGTRLAYAPYDGCPPPATAAFGSSCLPCPVCSGCPPCVQCTSEQQCPLRPGRFVRLVVQLRAATAEQPPTVQARHDGIELFPHPVPIPGLVVADNWQLYLSAATSADFDDNHWVDNLRLAAAPAQPVPPSLVNVTAMSISLAWFPPHHGGEPITLYRLQRREAPGWLTLYVGPSTTRTVRQLVPATTYLFRVQAYNSIAWSLGSHAASYTTAVPPLLTDAKPPRAPRVAAGMVRCGGRLYSAGGQHVSQPPGVSGGGRRFLRTFEQYDTATRTWLRRADMHVPRTHPGLACVRDRTVLVVGGYGTLGEAPYAYEGPLVSSEEYDPASDTWFMRTDAPSARYHFAVASEPRGHVFVAGGFGMVQGLAKAAYGTESVLNAFERYDPYSEVWVRKEPLPFAVFGLGLAVFDCARQCRVLAAGGQRASGSISDQAAIYEMRSGTWRLVTPLPEPRYGLTMLTHYDEPHVYATGGYELRLSVPLVAEAAAAAAVDNASTTSTSRPGAAAAMAAVAMHAAALRSVYQYSVATNQWWPVPSDRQWRMVDAFDWRHEPTIAATTATVANGIVHHANAPNRVRTWQNVFQRPWSARYNIYVGVQEFSRPEPARCRHGRTHRGCLTGVGIQRDEFGDEIALENRTLQARILYPPAWEPPLQLSPNACADCINLAAPNTVVNADGSISAVFEPGEPPGLLDDPDEYALVQEVNSTYTLQFSEYMRYITP